jgi:putative hemolysin
VKLNIATRQECLRVLGAGGCIGVFPGGTVSTSQKLFGAPMDPGWRGFTAKMIARSNATVVPIYFDGANSRLFQIASHVHNTLRVALLIQEFRKRVDEPVKVAIGAPFAHEAIDRYRGNPRELMDFLRSETYRLSPKPLKSLDYGFEFEEKHRL